MIRCRFIVILFLENPPSQQMPGWGVASCPDPDNNPGCRGGRDPEVLQEIQLPVAPHARCMEAAAGGGFGPNLETLFCWGGEQVELQTNLIIVSIDTPTLMIIASVSQFRIYLPWVNALLA